MDVSRTGGQPSASGAATLVTDVVGVSLGAQTGEPRLRLSSGDTVGRFVVAEHLGSGGMGNVYGAWDPQLARRIALKVIASHIDSDRSDVAQRQLQREAQTMAALSHPNVVSVHDVGVHQGHVFIAMELVEGGSLRRWLATKPPWQDALAALRAAGEGLAAAHRAGIVHRDFKPDNVLVTGSARRVLVTDFGLASLAPKAASEDGSVPTDRHDEAATIGVGTPAYMAPEQFDRGKIGPACDQFAFCVATWEALYGVRPFVGTGVAELAYSMEHGRRTALPRSPVPAAIRRALDRGLAIDPAERWPDMDTLLAKLDAASRTRRKLPIVIGTTIVALAGVLVLWDARSQCGDGRDRAGEAWRGAGKARGELAYAQERGSADAEHWSRTSAALDDYVQRWAQAYDFACASEAVARDGQMVCLREGSAALGELIDRFDERDLRAAHALSAALALPSPERCKEPRATEATPQDPELAAVVLEMREVVARTLVLEQAGEFDAISTLVEPYLDRAHELGAQPTALRIRLTAAGARVQGFDDPRGLQAIESVYWEAQQADLDAVASEASADLLLRSSELGAFEGIEDWVSHAESAAHRVDAGSGMATVAYLAARGALRVRQFRWDEALESYERARALAEAIGDAGLASTISVDVAACLNVLERADEAIPILHDVIAYHEPRLGPRHPLVAVALSSLGNALMHTGDVAGALALAEQAHAITIESYGRVSTRTLDHDQVMGILYVRAGRHAEGLVFHQEAAAVAEEIFGAEHPIVAECLLGVGETLAQLDRTAESEQAYERAVRLLEHTDGYERPLMHALNNLAFTYLTTDRSERAVPLLLRVIELAGEVGDVGLFALATCNLAELRVREGQPAAAVLLYEGALAHVDASLPAIQRAHARLWFARALWTIGDDRFRAHALAEQALELALGDPDFETEVRTWLREHTL